MRVQEGREGRLMIAKPNHRVIIMVMDEFVESAEIVHKKGIRGILAQYANPAIVDKENIKSKV